MPLIIPCALCGRTFDATHATINACLPCREIMPSSALEDMRAVYDGAIQGKPTNSQAAMKKLMDKNFDKFMTIMTKLQESQDVKVAAMTVVEEEGTDNVGELLERLLREKPWLKT